MSDDIETGERIRYLRKDVLQMASQAEFASVIGEVTRGAVGNWELGKGIKRENLQRIAKRFNVSFEWLSTGRGRMPTRESYIAEPMRIGPEVFEIEPDRGFDAANPGEDAQKADAPGVSTLAPYQAEIPGASPDIDVSAGAGPGGLPLPASMEHGGVVYSSDAIRGEILLPPYLLSEFTRAKAPRVHWVAVRGDSMTPTLLPGERVMVDTTDTAIGQGGVFVVRDPDGEILVKRLRKLPQGQIELVSDNERQGNSVHSTNDVQIVGRVVGRLGRL